MGGPPAAEAWPIPGAPVHPGGGHIEKEVPQPQEEVAFGFSITKRAPISSSEKSMTAFCEEGERDGVHHDLLPLAFEDEVVRGRIVELDLVLEARAAAALDRDAERLGLARGVVDLGQAREGAGGDFRGKGQVHRLGLLPSR
jgi:hypothetical protein